MRKYTRICTILLILLLMANFALTAYADGSVSYDAKANEFIFEPGGEDSPTDLFENLKDVMPGDSITEEIVIKNNRNDRKIKIRVYMRSKGAQLETDDFLSQLILTVEQKSDSILFLASADKTAQLTDWVYLGTVYSGGEITLDLTLDVPISMGNEYQNEIGYIDWEFKVEELPTEPSDPQSPATGDTSDIFLYSGLLIISLAALVILVFAGKRRKQSDHI